MKKELHAARLDSETFSTHALELCTSITPTETEACGNYHTPEVLLPLLKAFRTSRPPVFLSRAFALLRNVLGLGLGIMPVLYTAGVHAQRHPQLHGQRVLHDADQLLQGFVGVLFWSCAKSASKPRGSTPPGINVI